MFSTNILMDASIDYDLTRKIPTSSIVFLGLGLILMIALAVVLYKVIKHYGPSMIRSMLFGVVAYLLLGGMLVQILTQLPLMIKPVADFLLANKPAAMIYSFLMVCIIEEGGRFFVVKYMDRRHAKLGDMLLMGLGYGIGATILANGTAIVSNIGLMASINSAGMTELTAGMTGTDLENAVQVFRDFVETPFIDYICMSIEQCAQMVFHICMTYIVYRIFTEKRPVMLLAAMGIHAVFVVPSVLYQLNVIKIIYITTPIMLILTGLLVKWTYDQIKPFKTEVVKQPKAAKTEKNIAKNAATVPGKKSMPKYDNSASANDEE